MNQTVEEDALTFLTRALALRQQVIFACDQGRGSEIRHTPEQVQSLFLRRLELGIRDPTIWAKMGPCLSNPGITDQSFITTLRDIIAREEEHKRLIGTVRSCTFQGNECINIIWVHLVTLFTYNSAKVANFFLEHVTLGWLELHTVFS